MHRLSLGLLFCAVALGGVARAQPSATPAAPPPDSPRAWTFGATASVFAGAAPDVERDYTGSGLALHAGQRVRPRLMLLGRLAWTHSREVNPDGFDDFTWDERLDRFALDGAIRGYVGDHVWFEAAAGPVLAYQRWSRSDTRDSDSDSAVGLDTSVAIGIDLLTSRSIGPHLEGRAGVQHVSDVTAVDFSVGIGIDWR
jgi:hypothetical protein